MNKYIPVALIALMAFAPMLASAAVTDAVSTEVNVGAPGVDVSAGANADASVSDSMNANTGAAVAADASAVLAGDTEAQNATATNSAVSLEYPERAHFLGIFPVTVTAKATTKADGTVSVQYPWYRFLMSTTKDELQAALNAQVSTTLNASASAEMDAATQARVLAAMHDVMKARLAADTSANASADTNANY